MRWRLEPRAGVDAAAREQTDRAVAEVPGDRIGGVTSLLVLGEEADERALERRVQRREHDRQRGLGDPRVRGEGRGERAKALARRELVDESVERCSVHAAGGELAPRRHRSPCPSARSEGHAWARTQRDIPNKPAGSRQPPPGVPPYPYDDASWNRLTVGERHRAERRQLKRCCAAAKPSASKVSTQSAA